VLVLEHRQAAEAVLAHELDRVGGLGVGPTVVISVRMIADTGVSWSEPPSARKRIRARYETRPIRR